MIPPQGTWDIVEWRRRHNVRYRPRYAARQRYELEVGGELAFIDYLRDGRKVIMTHAEVPVALRGGGIGSALVEGALMLVRAKGEKVVPLCPFVAQYIRRHPETVDLLAGAERSEPRGAP